MANEFPGDQRDWTPQYARIGEFVVEFEYLIFFIRFEACFILQAQGLRKWELAEIIFNSTVFTAGPLFALYRSMAAQCLGSSHELIAEFKGIATRYEKLLSLRNDLLHGTYFIGPNTIEVTDKDHPSEFILDRRNPNKDGARIRKPAQSLEEFDGHIADVRALRKDMINLMTRIGVVIINNSPVYPK